MYNEYESQKDLICNSNGVYIPTNYCAKKFYYFHAFLRLKFVGDRVYNQMKIIQRMPFISANHQSINNISANESIL